MIRRREVLWLATVAFAAPAWAWDNGAPTRIETLPTLGGVEGVEPRVRVWLPLSATRVLSPTRVLYMLDGQYAFSADEEGVNFATDRRVSSLMNAGTIGPTLIVAIDNLGDDRFLQYMPQAIYEEATGGLRDTIEREMKRSGSASLVSDPFITWLETRLKPFVEARYGAPSHRLNSAIFGASMAGVMAGAIFVEAQRSFGRGACMSPNWAIYDARMIDFPELPEIWSRYFARLGAPEGRRLWLDHGTKMMDAGMVPHQTAIAASLAERGWMRGCNLQTRVYDAGHAFAETATQLDEVLAWLLA